MIVVLPSCSFLSETSRMIAIHRALQNRGIPVAMATHGGSHLDLLRAHVADVTVLEPITTPERSKELAANLPGIGSGRQSTWTDAEIRDGALAEASFLAAVGATAVVTGFALTTVISSRLAGVRQVTSHAGSFVPPVLERRMLPADAPGMPAFLRAMPRGMRRRLGSAAPMMIKDYTHGFNRVAKELGVESLPSFMALLCGDLTLVTEAPEVLGISEADMNAWRPGRGLRPETRMRYSGPLFARLDMPVPERVVEFVDRPGPVAYVALTSTEPGLVSRTIAATRAAGMRVLAVSTTHTLADPQDPDILVERVLPSHRVMPLVDLAVITGGQGSVQTALATGTPFVGIPLQPEQAWNVHVARRRGAARWVDPTAVERELCGQVRDLVSDDAARPAAEAVQRIYADLDGADRAAEVIADAVGAVTQ